MTAEEEAQSELPFAEAEPSITEPNQASAEASGQEPEANAGPGQSIDVTVGDAPSEEGMVVPASLLRDAEAKRDEYLALAQRAKADLENYRKRVAKERADLKRDSLGFFLKECLPALHDLGRVLSEGEKEQDYQTFHEGVRLMRDNLWKVMESAGVKEIKALGERFDPAVHEALSVVPSPAHEPNTVIEVFQAGFQLDDFVLAPARVIVSSATSPAGTTDDGGEG